MAKAMETIMASKASEQSAEGPFRAEVTAALIDPQIRQQMRDPQVFAKALEGANSTILSGGKTDFTAYGLKFFAYDESQPKEQRVAAEIALEHLGDFGQMNGRNSVSMEDILSIAEAMNPGVGSASFIRDYAHKNTVKNNEIATGVCLGSVATGAGIGSFLGPGGALFFGALVGGTGCLAAFAQAAVRSDDAEKHAVNLRKERAYLDKLGLFDPTK